MDPADTERLEAGSQSQSDHRLTLNERDTIGIGMPAHPPPENILAEMRHAVAKTGARKVYWYWMTLSNDRPHLGLAVAPTAAIDRVGQAVEPVWRRFKPANSTIDILMLDDSPISDLIRAKGRVLYEVPEDH